MPHDVFEDDQPPVGAVPASSVGQTNGVASLDGAGHLTSAQIPVSVVNISSFLGSSQVVRPSGDATGATDVAAINAALAGSNTSVYLNGNYVVNDTVRVPSNKTLILADAKITLAAVVNKPVVGNLQYDVGAGNTGDSNFHIRGIGRAIIDGNNANNTEQVSAFWKSTLICLCNASQFSITDVQTQYCNFVHIHLTASSYGTIRNLYSNKNATDLGWIHTDVGCTEIAMSGLRSNGVWADSVFSINTVNTAGNGTKDFPPYAQTLAGAARNISNLSYRDIRVNSTTGTFTPWVDGTGTISGVSISGVVNSAPNGAIAEFEFGPGGYGGTSSPAAGSMTGFVVSDYQCTNSAAFAAVMTDLTDSTFTNIQMLGTTVKAFFGGWQALTITAGYYPQAARLRVSKLSIPTLASGSGLCALLAGVAASDIEFEGVTIGAANGPLLANASDVTGISMSNVRIGTLSSSLAQSSGNELGVLRDVRYDIKGASLTSILAAATALRIEQPFPALAAADTAPSPMHGSEIVCYPGKDPTGGANAYGGKYVGDGDAWNLAVNLGTKFRAAQMYYPLLFHYDAGKLALANGASVPQWPDRAMNHTLIQATGANQPTFVAADATLNGLPSVAFNGSSQYLATSPLTAFPSIPNFSLFLVYYLTATPANAYIWQGAIASAAGPIYYTQTTTEHLYSGTSLLSGKAVASNTANVACAALHLGSTSFVGHNSAAFASLTAGSAGGTSPMTGITLGAQSNATLFAPVHVAEAICYQGIVSSGDYATIAAGLATKYAITLA